MNFTEWFNKKLVVQKFPDADVCQKFDVIINVSDEHSRMNQSVSKEYYWFPMNEVFAGMGINSIYGALCVLYDAEKNNQSVYLHCHGGVNRSPTVADCYWFIRTGEHRHERNDHDGKGRYSVSGNRHALSNNRLINNIESGDLPSIKCMERFLGELKLQLETGKIGGLDKCKQHLVI